MELSIVQKLISDLKLHDKVILIHKFLDCGKKNTLFEIIEAQAAHSQSIMVYTLDKASVPEKCPCRELTEEEYMKIEELRNLYDFSDHFCVISEETLYGTLFNYIETGILTEEEAFEAMFW